MWQHKARYFPSYQPLYNHAHLRLQSSMDVTHCLQVVTYLLIPKGECCFLGPWMACEMNLRCQIGIPALFTIALSIYLSLYVCHLIDLFCCCCCFFVRGRSTLFWNATELNSHFFNISLLETISRLKVSFNFTFLSASFLPSNSCVGLYVFWAGSLVNWNVYLMWLWLWRSLWMLSALFQCIS